MFISCNKNGVIVERAHGRTKAATSIQRENLHSNEFPFKRIRNARLKEIGVDKTWHENVNVQSLAK